MRNISFSISVFVASISFIAGCTAVDSADIKTHGIKPAISVSNSDTDASSHVSVTLHVGDSLTTFVNLDSDESVTANAAAGTPVTLQESNVLGLVAYSGQVDGNTAGTEIDVAVTRTNGNDSAPKSSVNLADHLSLTAPAPGAATSRANDDVTVTWTSDASTDGVHVGFSGDCIDDGGVDVAAGELTATIAKGTIKKKTGDNIQDSCDVNFSATRSHPGTVDAAFGGGSIVASFSSSAKVTSNP